ncbi:HCN4 [Symbiodinium natans]|uniref:HCN4 protein n=1 Tax=Symbiodinium natans TaxID=878477 RepID=A0A812HUV5_9DINO|nr:HCN4 [Symbiodinium natans]
MMELSMKTGGAVEALGKERIKSNLTQRNVKTARRFSGMYGAADLKNKCNIPVVKPNDKFRVVWDIMGISLIVMDAFLLPASIAWDLDVTPFPRKISFGSRVLQVFAAVAMFFWPVDIVINFNTGIYVGAVLETRRAVIARRYICSWFPFDMTVVTLDFVLALSTSSEEMGGALQSFRSARFLRVFRSLRIIRLLKAGKINVVLENLLISMGRQWLILAFTVGRMLMTIMIVLHILACSWFGLGEAVSTWGQKSWIEWAEISDLDGQTQYIHAMQWILLPPAPAPLSADSAIERLATIMTVVVTVLVIGTSLSVLTGTLQEIRQVNNERSRKRRELRIFLQTKAAPTELVMKVMSYADYKMARHSPIAFDETLISPKLEAELATFQHGGYLQEHPIFWLVDTLFPLVFNDLCSTLDKQLFCEGEAVFRLGTLAEMMYISSHGDFRICTDAQATKKFSGAHHYFAEVALYVEAAMHDCTLLAESFTEVFVLTSSKLAAVLANSPVCAAMYIEYANEYISHHVVMSPDSEPEEVVEAHLRNAENACESNSFYLDMYVDERKQLSSLHLSSLRNVESPSQSLRKSESASSFGSGDVVMTRTKSFNHRARTTKTPRHHDDQNTKHITPKEFIDSVFESDEPTATVVTKLRDAFVELDPDDGLHARFSDAKEQERAESAILSLIALVRGNYEAYTAPQKPAARLTPDQWQQLQSVVAWSAPDREKLTAAIFLLAVRGIGKCRSVTHQLPSAHQRPDQAVLFVLDHYPDAVPSIYSFGEDVRHLVDDTLELQHDFIFAQMLQGENVPANLLQLKNFINERSGEETLKFYVLFLLGFLSGLAGGQGSRFMTHNNAKATILGLSILKQVLIKDPAALYWTYIHNRGVELGRKASSTEDLAVLRLACLCRAQSDQDLDELQSAWDQLSKGERKELVKHFLADGIGFRAVVLEFLPLCLERAKKNPFVTVPTLLEVLVELLRAVRSSATGTGQTVPVDLADLAAFIFMVQNGFVFQTCLSRSKLQIKEGRCFLEMTQENWRRVSEPHTDVVMLASSVRELVQTRKREDDEKESLQISTPLNEVAVMSCRF